MIERHLDSPIYNRFANLVMFKVIFCFGGYDIAVVKA